MKKIVIVGGGIAGLTAAWLLHKKHKIILYEKKERVGGWIETIHQEGFLFERGPRGFLSSGKQTLQLCQDLKLSPIEAQGRARYIWKNNRLNKVSPFFFLRHGGWPCLKEIFIPRGTHEETIGAFFRRRFGAHFTDTFVDPLVGGIFGGNLNELSMQTCFPKFHLWEKVHGSLIKGFLGERSKKKLLSFENGMETLTKRLYEKLEKYIVLNQYYTEEEHDHLIEAIPQANIPHLTITTVHLGWRKKVLPLSAFGYLVPSWASEEILGVTFDSEIFPKQGTTLCVMLRGERTNAFEIALEAIERHLGIFSLPDVHDVHVAREAIPQYGLGISRLKNSEKITYLSNRIGVNDTIEDVYQSCFDL